MWRRCTGQGMEGTTLPTPLRVHQSGGSPNPVLLGFHRDCITSGMIIKALVFGDQFNPQALSAPGGGIGETEGARPVAPWQPAPSCSYLGALRRPAH